MSAKGDREAEIWPQLTARERAFVELCAQGKPYAYAARRAGYAPKGAARQGHEMGQRPHLRAAIDRRRRELAEEVGLSASGVLHELALIAHSDLGWFGCDPATGDITVKPWAPKGARRALAKVRRTVRMKDGKPVITAEFALWDKPAALLKAGAHTGAFDDERLGVEQLRDVLAAWVTVTQRTLEELLPAELATQVKTTLGMNLHAALAGGPAAIALASHLRDGDALDAADRADGAA